jgi:hypothetical protein
MLEDGTAVAPTLPAEQFAGPGSARVGYSEHNQRALLNRWADHMATPLSRPGSLALGNQPRQSGPARAGEETA